VDDDCNLWPDKAEVALTGEQPAAIIAWRPFAEPAA
jgi:hypothetical protein